MRRAASAKAASAAWAHAQPPELRVLFIGNSLTAANDLPGMVERRGGKILNVASTAAFQPGPLMAVYCATKAYVLSFSESIAEEVRGSGVTISTLCPGGTESGFQERAAMQESKFVQGGLMKSEQVAEAGYQGSLAGQTIIIPGLPNKAVANLHRFLPRRLITRMAMNTLEAVGH